MGAASTIFFDYSNKTNHLTPEKVHKNYSIKYQIGKGGFSQVFLSINKKDQSKVAMKRINIMAALSHTQGMKALSNELQVYQRIGSHENIVQLHCAYRIKDHFYFVMDCLLGGDLRHYLRANGRLSQQSICYIIASLGSGLHHMHQRGVIHRDIKPENIAFDCNGKPYLTDFGISHLATTDEPSSFISRESSGTLPYLAPEVLTRTHEHSYQSDFWSLGIVAYELVYNRRPFEPHVPLNFIYFVANQYSEMWDVVSEPSSSLERNLAFPHYHVTLNEDGSVPSSLMIPLSLKREKYETVDVELIDLMRGLLDIRIPQRLGSLERFVDFAQHPSFLRYGYHYTNLGISQSPVLEEETGYLITQDKRRSYTPDSEPNSSFHEQLSPSSEEELDKLFYVRSVHEKKADGEYSKKFADETSTQQISVSSPGRACALNDSFCC